MSWGSFDIPQNPDIHRGSVNHLAITRHAHVNFGDLSQATAFLNIERRWSSEIQSFSPTACYSEHRPLTSIRRAEDVLMLLSRPIFEPWCAGKADELKQMGAKRKVLLFLPFLLFFGAHGRLPHFVLPGTGTGS